MNRMTESDLNRIDAASVHLPLTWMDNIGWLVRTVREQRESLSKLQQDFSFYKHRVAVEIEVAREEAAANQTNQSIIKRMREQLARWRTLAFEASEAPGAHARKWKQVAKRYRHQFLQTRSVSRTREKEMRRLEDTSRTPPFLHQPPTRELLTAALLLHGFNLARIESALEADMGYALKTCATTLIAMRHVLYQDEHDCSRTARPCYLVGLL